MKKSFFFKPRARLLIQLGDQLIRNESIALVELIKNCYDADASIVNVTMTNLDNPESSIISIYDNGFGMDMDTIINVWLEPGSDYKEKLLEGDIRTPKYDRLPIGEKGIGRFGAHKLGNRIQLITRKKNHKEIVVNIDWKELSTFKYLEEAPIKIEERDPEVFKNNSAGTFIKISDLKNEWTRGRVREIHRSITALSSPFDDNSSFRVDLVVDNKEWLKGLPTWKDIKNSSLFNFTVEIEGNQIIEFEYNFTPWPIMNKIQGRKVTLRSSATVQKLKDLIDTSTKKIQVLNLNNYHIGKIKFSGLIFIRDLKILKLGFSETKTIRSYLNENGGIRVYRSGLRVYDYGEPGNDWLSLDYRRFNTPGIKVSNNSIVAAVQINRETSGGLVEKTNREGFNEDRNYEVFKEAIMNVLTIIEMLRRSDKDRIDAIYAPSRKSEPVLSSISELRNVITKITDPLINKEAKKLIEQIEINYNFMRETLTKSATAGLSLGVVIHEIDKIIQELEKVIKKEKVSDRTLLLIKHLSNLVESYSQILAKSVRKNEDLKTLVEQALFSIEFRLTSHGIQIIKQFENYDKKETIKVARNLVVGTLINIFDNSIYWLDRGRITNKKIFIDVISEKEFICLIIADNGPGFALPTDEIIEPFVSAKIDGLGLGLHIANEVMSAHQGFIEFPDWDEYEIPNTFKNGAIIKLGFKK